MLGGGGSGLSGYSSNGTTAYTLGNARGGAGGTASLSSDGGWTSSANGGTAGSPYGGTGSGVSYQCIRFSTGCASYNRKGGGGGGSGYCAPGYSCVADAKGATAATGRVVYCGPSSSSSCP